MKVLLDVLCVEVISVLYMEKKMIVIDTPQSIRYMWILQKQERKLTNLGANSATTNLDQKLKKSKKSSFEKRMLFSGFLVENYPFRNANHAAKLFRNMFSDSIIVNKYLRDDTKTTHMLTRAVSEQITSNLKEELL